MGLADGIRKIGFRKWYERELLAAHAHLALLLMCVLGLMMALEASSHVLATSLDRVIDAVSALLCAAVGLWALRRYLKLLAHAEAIAHQADCPACKAYGRLDCTGERAQEEVQVRCRGCGHRWTIYL
jgi:ABC-type nickel/cobalt efflux system permease component RcnA